jgi:hypothetical protein
MTLSQRKSKLHSSYYIRCAKEPEYRGQGYSRTRKITLITSLVIILPCPSFSRKRASKKNENLSHSKKHKERSCVSSKHPTSLQKFTITSSFHPTFIYMLCSLQNVHNSPHVSFDWQLWSRP